MHADPRRRSSVEIQKGKYDLLILIMVLIYFPIRACQPSILVFGIGLFILPSFKIPLSFFVYLDGSCCFLLFIAEWEKNTLRRANAAGFATIREYYRDKNENDPAMCNIAFELYNKVNFVCIRSY